MHSTIVNSSQSQKGKVGRKKVYIYLYTNVYLCPPVIPSRNLSSQIVSNCTVGHGRQLDRLEFVEKLELLVFGVNFVESSIE